MTQDAQVDDAVAGDDPAEDYSDGLAPPEAESPEAPPQVPAYIAIIRIVAVLGMGLCMSFGLFLMLVGLQGVLIGVPVFLLAVPFYYGMRLAERLAPAPDAERAGERH